MICLLLATSVAAFTEFIMLKVHAFKRAELLHLLSFFRHQSRRFLFIVKIFNTCLTYFINFLLSQPACFAKLTDVVFHCL